MLNNGGKPRQVDTSGFEVGVNLACTPSKVVYRNDLMELLQYEPQTEQVHATPLLCSPPWINKYYVMDLAPDRSFIEWAVQHGRTVFAISYQNPSAEMSGTTMDDYLVHGPQTALDVIERDHRRRDDRHRRAVPGRRDDRDHRRLPDPGRATAGSAPSPCSTRCSTTPSPVRWARSPTCATVEKLEKKMLKAGALEGETMAGTFDVLRANDLIFNYVVSNWLMGQHAAGVRHPGLERRQHPDAGRDARVLPAQLLRGEQACRPASSRLGGARIDLSVIKSPTYVVSAINDHIVPWESAYKTVGLVSGPVRFVLGSGGHIAGIVSPPGPKAWHMVSDERLAAGDRRGVAGRSPSARPGTWWEDWAVWSAEQLRARCRTRRAMGSDKHPVLGDGPGQLRQGLTRSEPGRVTLLDAEVAADQWTAASRCIGGACRRAVPVPGCRRRVRGTGCGRRWPGRP